MISMNTQNVYPHLSCMQGWTATRNILEENSYEDKIIQDNIVADDSGYYNYNHYDQIRLIYL